MNPSFLRRDLIFLALFTAYVLLFEGALRDSLRAVIYDGERNLWLGLTLGALQIVEFAALWIKRPFVRARLETAPPEQREGAGGAAMIFWVFHTVIAVLLFGSMLSALTGVSIGEADEENTPLMLGFIGVVLKELVVLGVLSAMTPDKRDASQSETQTEAGKPAPANAGLQQFTLREFLADLGLFSFAALAYTLTWSAIMHDVETTGAIAVDAIACFVLFLIFFLPLRIPFLLEEMAFARTPAQRLRIWGLIFAAGAIATFYAVF